MEWSEKLATGVVILDEQHQMLFQWFAELKLAAAEDRMMATTYALSRLTTYTLSHFAAEEKLMAEHAYPRLEEHRSEHEAFRETLRSVKVLTSDRDISEATVMLMRDWLVRHIMGSDMKYVPYLNDQA